MNSRISLIYVILIILLSSFASAFLLSDDNYNSLYLCPRETGYFSLNLTGTSSENINITTTGSASNWATLSSEFLNLNKNKSELLTIYVTPKSNTDTGTYNLKLNLNEYVINKKIIIKDCFKSDISALPKAQAVCPGEFAKYQFILFNLGIYEETFDLETSGLDNIKLSESKVTIAPGSSKTIYTYINAPKESGDYNIKLVSTSSAGNSKSVNFLLKVNPCYDYSINTEKTDYNICEHSTLVIPLTIKNSATISNKFSAKIESAPSFAKLTKTPLIIQTNLEKAFYLIISPNYNQLGNYSISIETTPEYGNLIAHNQFNITVRKCHDASLKLKQDYYEICQDEKATQSIEIINTGEFSKEFKIGKTNYEWLSFGNTSNTLKLNPLEKKQISLTITPDKNTSTKEYELGIGIESTDDSKISKEEKFKVLVLPKERCYSSELSTSNTNINLYYNNSKTIYIDVKNTGIYFEQYTPTLKGSAPSFINLSAKTLGIPPNKTGEFLLQIKPNSNTTQSLYELILNIKTSNQELSKTFKINITDNKADKGQEIIETTILHNISSWLYSIFIIESSEENPTVLSRLDDYKYHIFVLFIIIILIILIISKVISHRKKTSYDEPQIRITKKKK
jgi:uncharacterized membrane protein